MNRQDIERGIQDVTVRESTKAKLQKMGLFVPKKPDDVARGVDLFTEWENLKRQYGGVANIPFAELGEFLDRWTALIAYARWTEAIADIDQTTAREVRDTIRKQLYTIQDGGRELRDALVSTEPLYIQWENKFTENVALFIAVKALREGYEQRAMAISREITRRGADQLDVRKGLNRGHMA